MDGWTADSLAHQPCRGSITHQQDRVLGHVQKKIVQYWELLAERIPH